MCRLCRVEVFDSVVTPTVKIVAAHWVLGVMWCFGLQRRNIRDVASLQILMMLSDVAGLLLKEVKVSLEDV